MNASMNIPADLGSIQSWMQDVQAWLVGGSVRDFFLQRPTHDYDLVCTGDAIALGRRIANARDGDFFVLDADREICRIFLPVEGRKITLDLSALRYAGIEDDLVQRDFTINAMALDLGDETLLDPTGGRQDLIDRRLHPCAPDALGRDPVRALRAIRFAVELDLHWSSETVQQLRAARSLLVTVSPERRRDEFFSLLRLKRADAALRLLAHEAFDRLLFPFLPFPERPDENLYHKTVDWLCRLLDWLTPGRNGTAANLQEAQALLQLGAWRHELDADLRQVNRSGRSRRELLLLAAYLVSRGEEGALADADALSSLARAAAQHLHLSNPEGHSLKMLLRMQPQFDGMNREGGCTEKAGYRYFRQAGEKGSSGVLLFLARALAAAALQHDEGAHRRAVRTAAFLLEAVYGYQAAGNHPPLLDGSAVQEELGITPGPIVGELLEQLREAQALGTIRTREDARRFLHDLYEGGDKGSVP